MEKRVIDEIIEKRKDDKPKYNKNNVKGKVLDMLKEKDKTSSEIAELVGCTRQYVFMIAKEEGITLPRRSKVPKKKIKREIQELGKTGKYSVKQIAYMTNVDISYVYIALKEANINFHEIDAITPTYGPGLVGALLVGLSYAKALAFALDIPLVGVNNIQGHIAANYVTYPELKPPFLCMMMSGGNTQIVFVKNYTEFEVLR